MIRCASAGPIPSSVSSCSSDAELSETGAAGDAPAAGIRRSSRGRGAAYRDAHLLAVGQAGGEVHRAKVGAATGTRPAHRVEDARARAKPVDARPAHGAGDVDHDHGRRRIGRRDGRGRGRRRGRIALLRGRPRLVPPADEQHDRRCRGVERDLAMREHGHAGQDPAGACHGSRRGPCRKRHDSGIDLRGISRRFGNVRGVSATATDGTIRLQGLTKSFGSPTGPVHAVRGIDVDDPGGRDGRAARPERRRQVDHDRHAARPAPARQRHGDACSATRPSEAIAEGAIGAMLQTGSLLRDLSVRELLDMMASLYPTPLGVDEVIDLAAIGEIADRRTQRLSGGETQRVRFAVALVCEPDLLVLDEPTVAMDVEGRHAFWDVDARVRRPREDDRLRDALPRGGGRERRPGRADGAREHRRGRADHGDQGDGRPAHDPRHAPRRGRARPRGACRRQLGRAPRPGDRAALRGLRRRDPRAPRGLSRRPRHRDHRRRARAGVPPAHGGRGRDHLRQVRDRSHVPQPALLHLLDRVPGGALLHHRRPEPQRAELRRQRAPGRPLLHGRADRVRHDEHRALDRHAHRRRAGGRLEPAAAPDAALDP